MGVEEFYGTPLDDKQEAGGPGLKISKMDSDQSVIV